MFSAEASEIRALEAGGLQAVASGSCCMVAKQALIYLVRVLLRTHFSTP